MSLLPARALVAGACLALATTSNALPVSVALTGHLTEYAVVPEELEASIPPGARVTGSFSYDDEDYTPGALFFPTTYGQAAGLGLQLAIGGARVATDRDADPYANALPYATTTYAIQVLNDEPIGIAPDGVDRIAVFSYGNSCLLPTSIPAPVVQLFFVYPDLTGLDSASILELEQALRAGTLPPGTGLMSSIGSGPGPFVFLPFAIDAIWIVPEPSTALLAATGLLGLALRRSASRSGPPTPASRRARSARRREARELRVDAYRRSGRRCHSRRR